MSITLDKFKYDNVLQGALALFDSLGIKLVTPSDRPFNLSRMIVDPSIAVTDVLDKIEDTYFVGTIDDKALHGEDESISLDDEIIRIDEHYKGMMVFAIDVKDKANVTRTDIATLTRTLNRMSKAAPVALIVRYGDKISFSICERTAYKQGGHTGEKAGRVSILRDIDIENTHRGHIDILEMMRSGSITSFDELYAKWLDVFSSDTLTKRFYQELSNWYALAIDVIRFPNDLSTTDDDQKFNHEGAIRLITRLIFVWFLKQRKLIPDEFFDPKFVGEKLLKEFDPHKPEGLFSESARNSHYYRGILQNLFFATLNCPLTKDGNRELTERRFKDGRGQYNVNNLMRYRDLFRDPELFIRMCNTVPFLNGGLFDCLDEKGKDGMYYDGFSERQDSIAQLCVPDYLFFSDNIKADLSGFYDDSKQKNVTVRGLIDIFNRYQFTVEENTPLDQEVALDPELLGKVFENLLASFNPETKTTARKQTGSFYTPREIVQYMVDESLVAHLKKVVDPDLEPEYRKLLSYTDEPVNLTDVQKKAIMQGLYNCKILDPACGSGAFPMGILQQMVHILTKIDPDNTQWKDMLLDIAISETSDAYRTSSDAERQEAILDIEKSFNAKINRPDYARKLYLIENCIYGVDIQPIAIQISKLRFFISLVIDQITNDDPADNYGIRPLPNLEAKFVAANSLKSISRATTLGDTEEVKAIKEELKRLNHKIFSVKSWSTKKRLQTKLAETRQKLADELAAVGMFSESESIALASWDMFDQNHNADFFDPEWMFGIKDGFDIVIANPPYVEAKKLKDVVAPIKDLYKVYSGTADLSIYFIERGLNLLVQNGVLIYITTNKFFNTGYGKKLRHLILDNDIHKIINFEQVEVFENVLVSSVVLELGKQKSSEDKFVYEKFYKLNYKDFRPAFAERTQSLGTYKQTYLDEKEWSFADTNGLALKAKIESQSCLLGHVPGINVYRGVTTGYNPAFIIDKEKCLDLTSCEPNNTNIIKPLLQGRNIRKWFYNFNNEFLLQTGYNTNIPLLYPAILDHLKKYCPDVNTRSDQGENWWNLRACKYYDEFERDAKIIWGLTADKWAYTIDVEQHYLPSNGYILTSSDVDIYYILAILNSKLMEHYFHYIGVMTAGGAYTLKAATISALPFKTAMNMTPFIELAKQILSIKHKDNEADVTVLESQLDVMVYHLYGLTYDEVLVVDPQPPFSREDYENFTI